MDSKEAFRNYLKTGARIGEPMEKTFNAGYQAALASQAQQPTELVQYRQKDGTVWFYQSIEDTLPSWACDVKPYIPPAPEGDKE